MNKKGPRQYAISTSKNAKYLADYANDQRISFLPAIFSTSGRIDAEFLRLLFYHTHRESEDFFKNLRVS